MQCGNCSKSCISFKCNLCHKIGYCSEKCAITHIDRHYGTKYCHIGAGFQTNEVTVTEVDVVFEDFLEFVTFLHPYDEMFMSANNIGQNSIVYFFKNSQRGIYVMKVMSSPINAIKKQKEKAKQLIKQAYDIFEQKETDIKSNEYKEVISASQNEKEEERVTTQVSNNSKTRSAPETQPMDVSYYEYNREQTKINRLEYSKDNIIGNMNIKIKDYKTKYKNMSLQETAAMIYIHSRNPDIVPKFQKLYKTRIVNSDVYVLQMSYIDGISFKSYLEFYQRISKDIQDEKYIDITYKYIDLILSLDELGVYNIDLHYNNIIVKTENNIDKLVCIDLGQVFLIDNAYDYENYEYNYFITLINELNNGLIDLKYLHVHKMLLNIIPNYSDEIKQFVSQYQEKLRNSSKHLFDYKLIHNYSTTVEELLENVYKNQHIIISIIKEVTISFILEYKKSLLEFQGNERDVKKKKIYVYHK